MSDIEIPISLLRVIFTKYHSVHAFGSNERYEIVKLAKRIKDNFSGRIYVIDEDLLVYLNVDHIKVYCLENHNRSHAYILSTKYSPEKIAKCIDKYLSYKSLHTPLHIRDMRIMYYCGIRIVDTLPNDYAEYKFIHQYISSISDKMIRVYWHKKDHKKGIFYTDHLSISDYNRIMKEFNEGYFTRPPYVVTSSKKNQ